MKRIINKKIQQIQSAIIPTLRKYNVVKASLFGSVVRGEDTKNSDIDILVEFKGKKSLMDLVDLEMRLKILLKRKIDLLTYKSIHPLLKDKIMREQKEIL